MKQRMTHKKMLRARKLYNRERRHWNWIYRGYAEMMLWDQLTPQLQSEVLPRKVDLEIVVSTADCTKNP